LVRPSLIDLLKQLDLLDARILQQMVTQPPASVDGSDLADVLSKICEVTRDEAFLSLERLHELGCLQDSPLNMPRPRVGSKGRLLILAVSD
jgi:hypothetical protein